MDYTYFWVFSSSIPRENGGGLGMGSNLQNTEEYNINVFVFPFLNHGYYANFVKHSCMHCTCSVPNLKELGTTVLE